MYDIVRQKIKILHKKERIMRGYGCGGVVVHAKMARFHGTESES